MTFICPFLYGLAVVVDERHHAEARSVNEIRALMASGEEYSTRAWTCLCLQADDAHTIPGVQPFR